MGRERERERGARVEVLKDVKGEMSRGSTRVDARRVEGRRKEGEGRQEALYTVLPSYYPYLRV